MRTERRGVLHAGIQEAVELGCINGYKLEDALKQRSPLPEIPGQAKEYCLRFYTDIVSILAKRLPLLTNT